MSILLTSEQVSESIKDKVPTGTSLTSEQLATQWDDAARARAMFSARVARADILAGFQRRIQQVVDGQISQGQAREWMRKLIASKGDSVLEEMGFKSLEEGKSGGVTELGSDARLNLIIDQNVMMAHATAHYQKAQDNKTVYPYVRYRTHEDGRVRPSHAALNGKVFKADSNEAALLWPPNGFRCRCEMISITKDGLQGDTPQAGFPPEFLEEKAKDKDTFTFDPRKAYPSALTPRDTWTAEARKIYVEGTTADIDVEIDHHTKQRQYWLDKAAKAKKPETLAQALEAANTSDQRLKDLAAERKKVQSFGTQPPPPPPVPVTPPKPVTPPVPIVQPPVPVVHVPVPTPIKVKINPNNSMQVEPVVPLVFKPEAMRAPIKPQSNEEVKLRQKAEKYIVELDKMKAELDKKSAEIENEITHLRTKLDPVPVSKNPDPLAILFREESENDRMINEKIQNLHIDFILAGKDYEKQIKPIETAAIKTANKLGDLILSEMMAESTAKYNYPKDFNGNPLMLYKTDRKPEDAMKCKFSGDVGIELAIQILDTVKETAIESAKHGLPPLRGIKTHNKSGIAGDMGDGVLAVNGDVMSKYVKHDPKYSPAKWDSVDKIPVSTDYFDGPDKIKNIIWHEYGHHFHLSASVNHTGDYFEWIKPMEKEIYALFSKSEQGTKSSTEYAMKNAKEWFAENYALAKMNRWDLIDEYLFLKLSEMML